MRRLAVLALVLVAAGCGSEGSPVVSGDRAAPDPTIYEADATVLESPQHGPELCLGGVAESYPPQCGGPAVTNWDWGVVEGEETASGTTWGSYHVVGTFDGERFTLTQPPAPPRPAEQEELDDRFATPCEEPPGGWPEVEQSDAVDRSQQAVAEAARAEPDFAGMWIDHLEPPRDDSRPPGPVVLNVAFTGDLERHEAELRQHWEGPLCVLRHERSYAELTEIQQELPSVAADLGLELLSWGVDEVDNHVFADVVVARADAQQALDARFGEGAVQLQGRLQPVSDG